MYIKIRELNSSNKNSRDIWLPAEEEKLQEICNDLEIRMTTLTNCFIENVADKKLGRMLNNKCCNIDELNYLLKRIDGLNKDELATFYAAALAENEERVSELINLTFNIHRYCLISDFEDLKKAGIKEQAYYINDDATIDATYCFYDEQLAQWFDSSRQEILNIFSCKELYIRYIGGGMRKRNYYKILL